jgi:hypothetical protein
MQHSSRPKLHHCGRWNANTSNGLHTYTTLSHINSYHIFRQQCKVLKAEQMLYSSKLFDDNDMTATRVMWTLPQAPVFVDAYPIMLGSADLSLMMSTTNNSDLASLRAGNYIDTRGVCVTFYTFVHEWMDSMGWNLSDTCNSTEAHLFLSYLPQAYINVSAQSNPSGNTVKFYADDLRVPGTADWLNNDSDDATVLADGTRFMNLLNVGNCCFPVAEVEEYTSGQNNTCLILTQRSRLFRVSFT